MNYFARIAAACAIALAVAACAGGQAPVTKIGNDVQSYCIESRSERASYKDFCDVARDCKAADISKADKLAKDGADFCKGNPPDTETNRTKIKGIVSQQRAVGYAQ